MNTRKNHVIQQAHQLFIDKGFQATSIQDIIDYSGISKGTFYNYFSSKNELLIAIFKNVFNKVEQGRNELLIGQDSTNIEIFMKQIVLQLKTNKVNKLISLFEEVYFSKDEDLKLFITQSHLNSLNWLYERFIDLFGENKQPYLLDCAIMFSGILQHNLKYNSLINELDVSIEQIVRYCVHRIVKIVNEVSESGDQLIEPDIFDHWISNCKNTDKTLQQKLYHIVLTLKKSLDTQEEQVQLKFNELLNFLLDELLNSNHPRKFLIHSALLSLKTDQAIFKESELQKLEKVVTSFFPKKG